MQHTHKISVPFVRTAMIGVSLVAVAAATPAMAQVEEIVVTAQKVKENVQDVPISITAVSGDTLTKAGTSSLENLGQLIPSVTFRKGTTNANSAVVLRGVGTISFSIAAEPSVSTVVDGVVLSRSGQAFADLVEIERLEVLRGPQGTLFGKNASAGLINIISKGGTQTTEGEVSVSAFEGREYKGRMTVSGPVAENLTARFNAFYGEYAGNITNINAAAANDRKVNGYQHVGARALVDYDNGSAKVRVIADYYKGDDDCCADVTGISRGAVLDAELGYPTAQGINQRTVNHNLVTRTQDQQWGLTVNADFDVFSGHTLSAIYGYRNWQNTEIREGDFLPRAIVGTAELHDNGFVETNQQSFELRLASPQDQALTYQIGGFYWKSQNDQDFTRRDITCATSTLPVAASGATPCNVNDTVNTLFPTATSHSVVDIENYAAFAQATYNFTDWVALTGGLRWTHDAIDYAHLRFPGVNATTGLPLTGPGISGSPAGGTILSGGNGTVLSTGSSTNSNVSGKAVLTVKPSDDILLYGSYTRGYKGPAFNVFFNHTAPNNAVPIGEETSNSYEAGIKSRLLDRRLQLNLAVYSATYNGFQANNFVQLPNNGGLITNLTNAGTVRTQGFELDAQANPFQGFNLFANIAYADAKVKRFNPNPLTNAPNAQNGTRLPLAPKWSWNVGGDYEGDLGPAKLYLRTSYSYSGSQFSDLGNAGPIDGYGLLNASIGFSDADDMYRITFSGRNIADKQFVTLNVNAGQRYQIPRDADRYFGVTLRARLK